MAVRVSGSEHQARPVGRRMVPVLWVVAPAVLAGLILGGFALYAKLTPYSAKQSSSPPVAVLGGGLAWDHTILFNRREMKSWLRQHGASYRVWKRRHPAAYAIVTHTRHTNRK